MTTEDFDILGLKALLAASKRAKYRKSVIGQAYTLIAFLEKHQLANCELLKPGQELDEHFKVMKSSLTDDGYELIKLGLDKWDEAIDSGCPIEDTTILEQELAKIRAK